MAEFIKVLQNWKGPLRTKRSDVVTGLQLMREISERREINLKGTQARIGTLTNLGKCLSTPFLIPDVGYLHLWLHTLCILKSSIKMCIYSCLQK